jgi:hypothetical protein
MTVNPSIDPARLLEEQLAQASPDLLRELLQTFINTLLSAEADVVCGAEYGATSPERINRRNGYRHRGFDTRAGTLDVAVPKLRQGSYFPEWLLERRKRAERALTSVMGWFAGTITITRRGLADGLAGGVVDPGLITEGAQPVVAAAGELAGHRQSCPPDADSPGDLGVVGVVRAGLPLRAHGALIERPAQRGRALPGQRRATFVFAVGVVDRHVQAGVAHRVPGGGEPAGVAELLPHRGG